MTSTSLSTLGRLATLCALPLALAACQGEKKPAEARTAQGEILAGSASDAMLPLDTVRSQPPLAPEATSSDKPGREAARGGASGDASEAAGETADTPAAGAASSPAPSAASQAGQ